MLLIHLLEIIIIVHMLVVCTNILFLLFLSCQGLGHLGLSFLDLLALVPFIAVSMRNFAVFAFEDHRLVANSSVDVEDHGFLAIFVIGSSGIVILVLFAIFRVIIIHVAFLRCLDNIQIVGLLLVAAEVFYLWSQTGNVVKLELPF